MSHSSARSAPGDGRGGRGGRGGRVASVSPPPRRSLHRDVVVERVVEKVASASPANYPLLTKSNYNQWALLMRIKMEARGLWEVVETDDADF
jgi:hypothetical protein